MTEEKAILESISKKLDIIVGLLISLQPRQRSEKEDILALKEAGLGVEEIARALGKTANSIYLVLSRTRRRSALNDR